MRSGVYRRDERFPQDVSQSVKRETRNTPTQEPLAELSVKSSCDEAVPACVTRVLRSETFRRAPRLRSLLSYMWKCASAGRITELTEQQIGTAVFGRPVDYDCANDNIVRVTVRQLRLKLQEYYESEGATESEKLVIPKGYYVPELVPRHFDQHLELTPKEEVQEHREVPVGTTTIPETADPADALRFWRRISIIATAMAIGFAGLWLFTSRSVRRVPISQSNWRTSNNLVKALILVPRQKTPIILGDTGLQIIEEITGRAVPLGEHLSGNFGRVLAENGVPARIVHSLIANRNIEETEVVVATRILQANPDQAAFLSVGGPNSIEVQDLRSLNVILIGNPRSNPWITVVSQPLNFHVAYDKTSGVFLIRNREPKLGEPPQYRNGTSGEGETSYGFIGVTPNLSGNGSVLIISGTSVTAIASVADFVCHPEAAQRVAGLFRIDNLQQTAGLELVLKVESVQGIPRVSQVAASRVNMRVHG